MKVVILAGGYGTRLSEETAAIPKPMVAIGGRPILWHIMKIYSHYGFNEFIVCLGYKGYVIKEYFSNYLLHQSDVTIDLATRESTIHSSDSEPWRITLIDTGADTMTGGRIRRIQTYVGADRFFLTYGDGLADVDLHALLACHEQAGRYATLTAVQPLGRFGAVDIDDDQRITRFREKPKGDGGWINGGFFVLEPEVFDYVASDQCVWEQAPLHRLSSEGQLTAYRHDGFWRPMDTLRDKTELEALWNTGRAKWQMWA